MKKIFQLEAIVGEDAYDQALGLLTLEVPFGWEEESLPTGESRFRVHCENADFIRNLCNVFEVRLPGQMRGAKP